MSALEQARHFAQRQQRAFVDWDRFWSDDWPIKPEEHRLYIGAQRSVWDVCCHRQICDFSLAPYPELSIIGPYVKAIERQEGQRRVDHPHLLQRRPPIFFDGMATGNNLVYVDLEAAYWQLYTRTTLDVFYDGERPPMRGVVAFEDAVELRQFKLARNALLGICRRVWRRGLDHGEYFKEELPPFKRRPDLWGLVMDCLEVVMWSARDLGAIYVHTDGAIFPHHDLAENWLQLLEDRFRLSATIKARGPGIVTALGRFQIGETVAGRPFEISAGHHSAKRFDSMLHTPKFLEDALTEWLHEAMVCP